MHQTNSPLFLCLSLWLPTSISLAHSSHSLQGIRHQPRCCDGRWQLAQKGWHVTGKCAAPKMSFLIKRFWSVVNCRMFRKNERQHVVWKKIIWNDNERKKCALYCSIWWMLDYVSNWRFRKLQSHSAWMTEWEDILNQRKRWEIVRNWGKYDMKVLLSHLTYLLVKLWQIIWLKRPTALWWIHFLHFDLKCMAPHLYLKPLRVSCQCWCCDICPEISWHTRLPLTFKLGCKPFRVRWT